MVGAAYVQYWAFPRELRLEKTDCHTSALWCAMTESRVRRVTALEVLDVSASEKRAALRRIAGGTAEGIPFVPIRDGRLFIFSKNR